MKKGLRTSVLLLIIMIGDCCSQPAIITRDEVEDTGKDDRGTEEGTTTSDSDSVVEPMTMSVQDPVLSSRIPDAVGQVDGSAGINIDDPQIAGNAQSSRVPGAIGDRGDESTCNEAKRMQEESISVYIHNLIAGVQDMTRPDVLFHMDRPFPSGEDFYEPGSVQVDGDHALLGISNNSRYWVQHVTEQGSTIEVRGGHYYLHDNELDRYLRFRKNQAKFEKENKVCAIFIDMIFIYWLIVTGRMHILKESGSVQGSFISLQEEDADRFLEFRRSLEDEKRKVCDECDD